MAVLKSFKCLIPLEVGESGNSAISFSLLKVTFLTSIKHFSLLFEIKKSNLVFSENFTSFCIKSNFYNVLIFLFRSDSDTNLLVR